MRFSQGCLVTPLCATPCFSSQSSDENYKKLAAAFGHGAPKFFTFNDGWTVKEGEPRPASVDYAFNELLPSMFPAPSQYELGDVPW